MGTERLRLLTGLGRLGMIPGFASGSWASGLGVWRCGGLGSQGVGFWSLGFRVRV